MKRALYGDYFCGNQASEYARQQGWLDAATFSKAFDAVMNNNIMFDMENAGFYFEQVNGMIDNDDEIEEKQEEIESLQERADELQEALDDIDDRQADLDEHSPEYAEAERDRTGTQEALDDVQAKIDRLQEDIDELDSDNGTTPECFQFFIVSDQGAELIQEYTDDPLFYCEALDMYIWGVTHWGTSWDYVLTDIKLNAGEEAFQ
jgi:cell fate (sporulation/competence/biofilm development) regulator YmcA (YheA/YmcA/DUF963 family)